MRYELSKISKAIIRNWLKRDNFYFAVKTANVTIKQQKPHLYFTFPKFNSSSSSHESVHRINRIQGPKNVTI